MEFKEQLKQEQLYIEKLLEKYLPVSHSSYSEKVIEAMRYSLLAGGKRIRPIFIKKSYECFKPESIENIDAFLVAIEMIHTYSLIHDDLPAIDNDELRRGLPTCHIKFGEDIAILAGDALLNHAFEVMIEDSINKSAHKALRAMQVIARASGTQGMIGGQVADVLYDHQPKSIELLQYIHRHKTAAIIEASFACGAILADASEKDIEKSRCIGNNIGLAFQIQDDILDVVGSQEELGKPIHSDLKNSKDTYVTLVGIEAAQQIINTLINDAILLLKQFKQSESHFLIDFMEYIKMRRY